MNPEFVFLTGVHHTAAKQELNVKLDCICSYVCPPYPEQPHWADDDGEQKDQPAGPSRVSEEEWHWTTEQLPLQNTQPDTHVETAGGNTHAQ